MADTARPQASRQQNRRAQTPVRYLRRPYELRVQLGQTEARSVKLTTTFYYPGATPYRVERAGALDLELRCPPDLQVYAAWDLEHWFRVTDRDRLDGPFSPTPQEYGFGLD